MASCESCHANEQEQDGRRYRVYFGKKLIPEYASRASGYCPLLQGVETVFLCNQCIERHFPPKTILWIIKIAVDDETLRQFVMELYTKRLAKLGYDFFCTETQFRAYGVSLPDDRLKWSNESQYVSALLACVGQVIPGHETGLEWNYAYVRALGGEISEKFGFEGMQRVWGQLRMLKGPAVTSDLSRVWDGVGGWQK